MIDLMQPRSIATKSLKQTEQPMQIESSDQSDTTASTQLKNIKLNDKPEEKKIMSNEDFRAFLKKN